MLGVAFYVCVLCTIVRGALEDLKKEVFSAENTGKWKGKSDAHVPTLDMEPIRGGGWNARMWTTHVKNSDHFITKHFVEDGDGNLLAENDFKMDDENPLNQEKNQTTHFKIPKGANGPLSTYAVCNLHGTWVHTWDGIELWHFQDDVKFDEHGNEIQEEEDEGTPMKKAHEVPVHAKVTPEEIAHLKEEMFTVETPGRWRGKSDEHVPSLDLHLVEGGGYIAELTTEHRKDGKDSSDSISKHWLEDAAGTVLGVVDFDADDDSTNDHEHVVTNEHKKQVSRFHVPKGAAAPLKTFANCKLHGTWWHEWEGITLDHGADDRDEL